MCALDLYFPSLRIKSTSKPRPSYFTAAQTGSFIASLKAKIPAYEILCVVQCMKLR